MGIVTVVENLDAAEQVVEVADDIAESPEAR